MIIINKKEGELLSELVVRARAEYQIPVIESVTYAGRLDPMASGIMVFLVGKEEIAQEKNFVLGMSKGYEFEVLLGVSTDTHDVLGIIDNEDVSKKNKGIDEDTLRKVITRYNNSAYEQVYPSFSSKPIDGKPAFMWAKDGVQKELPSHLVTVHKIQLLGVREMTGAEIVERAITRVQNIHGDFRQKEIIDAWNNFAQKNADQKYTIAKIYVDVSSGTYIRVLACDIARDLDTHALAFSIARTRVGLWGNITPVC